MCRSHEITDTPCPTLRRKNTDSVAATNIANRRVLLDNSLTLEGFHYNIRAKSAAKFEIASTINQERSITES
jgi:hypothetical protein